MSYMDHNATFAPAGGIQELSFDEIGMINGSGFFERLGEMADNSWRTAGRAVDFMIRTHHQSSFAYQANGMMNIK